MRDDNGEVLVCGVLAWDKDAKETVRISNARCQACHERREHDEHVMVPFEAVAVRVIGWVETKRGSRPQIAYTYRGVRAESLEVLRFGDAEFAQKAGKAFPWPEDAQFVGGRI